MANEVLLKSGTPIAVTITLAALTTSTTNGARESAKIDFGATRAQTMLLRLQTAFTVAPTAGGAIEVYVGFSSISTAASGNPANLTGADAAYAGYGNDVDVARGHLTFVGIMSVSVTTSTIVPQVADIGLFVPTDRYGIIVVCPRTSQALSASTTIHAITIYPVVDEVQ